MKKNKNEQELVRRWFRELNEITDKIKELLEIP